MSARRFKGYALRSEGAWFVAFDLWQSDKARRVCGDRAWAEAVRRLFPGSVIVHIWIVPRGTKPKPARPLGDALKASLDPHNREDEAAAKAKGDAQALAILSLEEKKLTPPAPVAVPAAVYVVAANSDGCHITTLTMFEDEAERDRASSVAAGDATSCVLRYVPEAALAAARREERARLCALFAPLFEMGASVAEIAEVVKTLDEKKGQAK